MTKNPNYSTPLKLLLIDNYDSFSYNLVELFRAFENVELHVLKNDDLGIFSDDYDAIVISPGPGLPSEAGFLLDAIEHHHVRVPLLGICLGLQAIVEYYGGQLRQLSTVFHGIRDEISLLDESPLFKNIPPSFFAGRYHSWVGAQKELPSKIRITAIDQANEIMAIDDVSQNVYACQFHPESYMTEYGHTMIQNFIILVSQFKKSAAAENAFLSI